MARALRLNIGDVVQLAEPTALTQSLRGIVKSLPMSSRSKTYSIQWFYADGQTNILPFHRYALAKDTTPRCSTCKTNRVVNCRHIGM